MCIGLAWTCDTHEPSAHTIASTVLDSYEILPAKDELERQSILESYEEW